MWSKNKSCFQIANIIEAYCPNNDKLLVELFCGWFSVWEVFLKKWYKVIANDKNKYVIALLNKVINGWLDEKKCLEWVSRKLFIDVRDNPNKYEDWYVWYVLQIWSFGNNQKGYLFSEELEIKKHSLYELVVNKKSDDYIKSIMPQKYIDWITKQTDRHKRRVALKKVLWALKDRKDLQSLERLQSLQSLESLERLQSLESLERQVEFISKSYEEIEIPSNAIVYCDPPYQWTAEYREWSFNHNKFREYIRNLSKTNKVFVSEYNAPSDFKCIYSFNQKSSLWGGNQSHNNQPSEKLFIYNPILNG